MGGKPAPSPSLELEATLWDRTRGIQLKAVRLTECPAAGEEPKGLRRVTYIIPQDTQQKS